MALTAIRQKAATLLARVPPLGQEIRSLLNNKDNKLFTELTNTSHTRMKQDWDGYPDANGVPTKKKGIMTGCNGFTGWYTTMLGQPVSRPLGVFELEKILKQYKMEKAWVPSTEGARPKYGDVVRWTKYHVCVSEGFDGDIWNHCDAGQGGSKTGYDILKRVQETQDFDHTKLLGWLDIDIAFGDGASAATEQSPDWLLTWWQVKFRGSRFYYEFRPDKTCSWTTHVPISSSQHAGKDVPAGRWVVTKDKRVNITWNTGTTESFAYVDSGSPYEETMVGKGPENEEMPAVTYF